MLRCASASVRISIGIHSDTIRVVTESQVAFGRQKPDGALKGTIINAL